MAKRVLVVRSAGVEDAIRRLKADHQAVRAKFPDVQRYLNDHLPELAAKVAQCRSSPRVARDLVAPDRYKVQLLGCHVEPWCISCVQEAKVRRAMKALDRFQRCTPTTQQPRYAHIVQTAMLLDGGIGWGHQASRRVKDFMDTIWRGVQDAYGPTTGAYLSYQAFGERAFGKLHPHVDLTVNGWQPTETGPQRTPNYQLQGGGHARWIGRTRDHAAARFLVHQSQIKTNLNVHGFVVGRPAYYGAILYQVRELVDVRKMAYDRANQVVHWLDYRENRRERMTVQDFKTGLIDYQSAVGEWGNHQARHLHRGYGHLADKSLKATEKAMGGQPQNHRKNCPCGDCSDWETIFRNEDGDYDFDPWSGGSPEA